MSGHREKETNSVYSVYCETNGVTVVVRRKGELKAKDNISLIEDKDQGSTRCRVNGGLLWISYVCNDE